MTTQEVPEGSELRDDGCICPKKPQPKLEIKFQTCPTDPRFPHTNQTKRCFFSFIDYQRCVRLLGDYPGCNYFLKCYRALCPSEWVDTWYGQMEKGTFPRKIYPPRPIIYPDPKNDASLDDEPPPPC